MIKFLIISFLIIYIIYKLSGFIFKIIFSVLGGGPQQNFQTHTSKNRNRHRPKGSNVDVDYVPNDQKNKKRKTKDKSAGEYIDYEEV